MKTVNWVRGAVVVALAAAIAGPAAAKDMGPGILVGQVVDRASPVLTRKVVVMVGNRKWVVHVDTKEITHAGARVSVHQIHRGIWIKAVGERIGGLRLKASGVDVIGDTLAYRKSRAFRRRQPGGYFVHGK